MTVIRQYFSHDHWVRLNGCTLAELALIPSVNIQMKQL